MTAPCCSTPRFSTHVCLVSAQATPNLTPALDADFAPKNIVLLVSKDMERRADDLAAVLKRRGTTVSRVGIADAYDYFGVEDTLLSWLAEHESEDVALNVTGGTKVMAMAAQEVFRSAGKPAFYVSIDTDEIIFLGEKRAPFRLGQKVKLRDYLEAHGYTLLTKPARPHIEASERDLTEKLVYDLAQIGRGLGALNWLAQEAKQNLRSPELTESQLDSKQLDELIYRFSSENLLELEGKRLVFPTEAARQFINGGWLELYVYRTLSDLAPKLALADWAIGLEVVAPNDTTRNELDAAFLRRNRLHLIECKAANLAAPSTSGGSKGADAIYKLETLLKLGGIATRGMLIDYRGALTPTDLERARQSRIEVVSGADVRRLRERLLAWVR